jgi:putative transposase
MKTSPFSDEQITLALRQAEAGTPVPASCRTRGVSEPTVSRWKKRFGTLGVSELRELRQLREENRTRNGVVAVSLDKTILQEALQKTWGGQRRAGHWWAGPGKRTGSQSGGRVGR